MIIWKVEYEEYTADPLDGGEPFCFWWEDMRTSEVKALVEKAYQRGYDRGRREEQEERCLRPRWPIRF